MANYSVCAKENRLLTACEDFTKTFPSTPRRIERVNYDHAILHIDGDEPFSVHFNWYNASWNLGIKVEKLSTE
jgi:hypothetical protein